jgi:hypothetical protein
MTLDSHFTRLSSISSSPIAGPANTTGRGRDKGKQRVDVQLLSETDDSPTIATPTILQTIPPTTETGYQGARFPIEWKRLRYQGKQLTTTGEVGDKISGKQRYKRKKNPSPIWLHGACLEWGNKVDSVVVIKELWCCQRCHNEGQYHS